MSTLSGSKVAVIGGAGFVGSNLVDTLLAANAGAILVVDNLLSAERENVSTDERVRFLEGSITNDAILAALPEDLNFIFHLATYHGNQSSIADPLADHENNTFTTLKLCERIKGFLALKKVVYSSAGCTVAEKTFEDAEATTEDAPISLYHDTPYQISKIIGELYFNYYFLRYKLPVVKARFQNVYGPKEILGAGKWRKTPATVWRNVTPTFIYRALKKQALGVENGGVATRDFIYATDIARGLLACAERGQPGEVFNLASGVETSVLGLAELVNELTQNPTPIDLRPAREWDRSGKRFGSPEKAQKELGFSCSVGLREGLMRTITWTRDHLVTIDRTIQKHAAKLAELERANPRTS